MSAGNRIVKMLAITAVIAMTAWAQFDGGTGTEDDPYVITTAAQLARLAADVSDLDKPDDKAGVHYKLGDNIDLSVAPNNIGYGWAPIGQI